MEKRIKAGSQKRGTEGSPKRSPERDYPYIKDYVPDRYSNR